MEARDAYERALKSYGPLAGVNISTHGGSFSKEELDRYSKASPAAVLALLSFELDIQEGYLRATANWGVVVFTENKPGKEKAKDRNAVHIATMCSAALLTNYVDLDCEFKPQSIDNRNQFGAALDKDGVAMWSLEFTSSFEVAVPTLVTDELTSIHATWDLAPRDGDPEPEVGEIPEAEDEVDLA